MPLPGSAPSSAAGPCSAWATARGHEPGWSRSTRAHSASPTSCSHGRLPRHLTDPLVSVVLAADGGRSGPDGAALAELHADHPAAVIGGPEIIAAAEDANADTQAWVNYLLLGLVIAFAAFAVVNTLMLAIRDRSREFALLQLVGASRLQVRRMMRVEALMLVLLGWGIGGAVAATTLLPFAQAVTGSPRPDIPVAALGAVLLGTAVLAWLATMVPTRGTMRDRPVDAIGIRE